MFSGQKSPAESFGVIIKIARICSTVVGADVASPDYRVSWVTIIVASFMASYFVLTIYTVADIFADNPTYTLEVCCMMGSAIQGVNKLATGIRRTKDLVKLRFHLESLYEEYEKKGSEYCVALLLSCKRANNIIKLVGLIYLLSILGVIMVPIVFLIFTEKRYMMMHCVVPGLDVTTSFGYFTTLSIHAILMLIAAFGLFSGDIFILIFLGQSFLFVDILKLKIRALNEYSDNFTEYKIAELQELLKDVIKWHQRYTKFNQDCNDVFQFAITVQITTASLSILCTLYIVLTGDWPGVYAYLLMALQGLYTYCFLGTQIEICNDNFTHEIYNMLWFNLPPAEQRMVRVMLMKSQSPATVDIAGVMPLSVSTGLQITKSLYSIFMMMVQVLIEE